MSVEELKKAAAEKAVEQVESGMVLGLGTGSTTKYAVIKIGELWQAGQLTDIVGFPTSEGTAKLARQYDIPLTTLDEHPLLDLVIDGADEVAPNLDLIKGLGGALLREKMVETSTRRFIVVVDGSKVVRKLGTHSPLPVEVAQFGWRLQARWLETLGCRAERRLSAASQEAYITDNGNYILDCSFPEGIDDPPELAATLRDRVGVVEHGLFLNMAQEAIVARLGGLDYMHRS
jgi:ribose 5-phosphate isomerase A